MRQVLCVVKYVLQHYSASVKQTARARKLKVDFAQTMPNVSVVLLQCLKQECSINYHDYLKKKKGGVEGEPGSLQLHPRGVLPQALH